jgi:hypothetical protein
MGILDGNTYAKPGLWDQTSDAKANMLHGLEGVRPIVSQSNYGQNADNYANMGLSAQLDAADFYRRQMEGLSPSIANMQMQQGIEQNNRAAMGLMGQARGGNVASAYGQALGAQQGANLQAAQMGSINRLAEQQAAAQAYANLGSQMAQGGLGWGALSNQNALGLDQNALGWYGAKRGLDLQQRGQDRDFYGGLIRSGAGMIGSMMGAVSMGG